MVSKIVSTCSPVGVSVEDNFEYGGKKKGPSIIYAFSNKLLIKLDTIYANSITDFCPLLFAIAVKTKSFDSLSDGSFLQNYAKLIKNKINSSKVSLWFASDLLQDD